MTNKKISQIRAQSTEELIAECTERQNEIFQLRGRLAMKDKEVKPHFIRQKRKEIAQTKTILSERQRGGV